MRRPFALLCCLVIFAGPGFSQEQKKHSFTIKKATAPVIVDGQPDEADWKNAEVLGNFYENFPYDTLFAISKTEVRTTYDDHNLYITATCYDELPGNFVIQTLKRDFTIFLSDAFVVYLNPSNDQTIGFSFALSPLGVQREGLIDNGGALGTTTDWDNRWTSAVKALPGKWVLEIGIPFKTLRFKEGEKSWRINFARLDLKRNENSSWAPVPRNFNLSTLTYTGVMNWEMPPKKPGVNISLIPYTIGGINRNFAAGEKGRSNGSAGMDAKIAVTSSLNLDLTVNPDFSQVDADRQIINLTRFNLFFPERRQFFIENSDLFSSCGFRQIRPFFSRRIGLNNGKTVPIYAGARLSGKLNQNWRIGLMNVLTENDIKGDDVAQNYTVAAVQRQVFKTSNIAAIFVNRQGTAKNGFKPSDFNRIAGLDYNIQSQDNVWRGKLFYHQAFTPQKQEDQYAHASWLMYSTRRVFAMWNHEYVGKNFQADVGFVPRRENYDQKNNRLVNMSYWRLEPEFNYSFYPKSKVINTISPGIYVSTYHDSAFRFTESDYMAYLGFVYQNSAEMRFEYDERYTRLFFPSDVTGADSILLPAGIYHYRHASAGYSSNLRKPFNWSVSSEYGKFYTGNRFSIYAALNYRWQPYAIFSAEFQQERIYLPDPGRYINLLLLGTTAEISFSKSVFFKTFVQYNTQIDNININSRFQWRFRPMSDLFIVYTDNYDSSLGKKNKAIVAKLVWWVTI
jgi:hypothetical protein